MTTEMGPPPPRNPRSDSGDPDSSIRPEDSKNMEETSSVIKISMPPPPPKNPDSSETSTAATDGEPDSTATTAPEENTDRQSSAKSHGAPVPYKIPPWSEAPCHTFYIEVLKDGAIIDQLNIHEKGAYMFGRVDLCDFVLEHPTISRFHAVVQFNKDGDAYLYDLGSTHGTFVNKSEVKKKVYVDLHVGDVIRFGQSSRLYLFQGPTNLMPQETDYKVIREARIREKMRDKEASLRRAKDEAVLADGISWGMGEDAVEEEEDEGDEVMWQTYKGQLTEKQEKTREKVIKRTQKIAHMKKEIDAIRAKDISQGGLTQGQQTQIARNEQRIMQIMEELENLEETLNESIRESIGARTGRISRGKNRATEEDDELLSDDDEFYDRVKKKSSVPKPGENQSIETADTLLDKRDTIMKEIEDKKELLLNERKKSESGTAVEAEAGDSLDAYMSGLSSQLIIDKTMHIEKEITSLQSELDRVSYLLKFADPTGEASKRRALKGQEPKPVKLEKPDLALKKSIPIEVKESIKTGESTDDSKEEIVDPVTKSSTDPAEDKTDNNGSKEKPAVYTVIKPQWLGAVEDKQVKESPTVAEVMNIPESDQFVDYKERKKILNADGDSTAKVNLDATSGLIIRKRKHVGKPEVNSSDRNSENSTSRGTELPVEDAVALLLKHQKGIYAVDNEGNEEFPANSQQEEDKKRPKRVLGPEKPSFLDKGSDYEAWVPPEGQSGDGRTSLNDRYGY